MKEKQSIPFFGLRKINSDSGKLLLALDIWKYNYKWFAFLGVAFFPFLLILLLERSKFNISEDKTTNKNWKYAVLFLFGITGLNLII